MRKVILAGLFVLSAAAHADHLKNKDVRDFKDNAEVCEHLSGEWDSELPEENKHEIKVNMNDSCGKAQALYGVLKKKYRSDVAVMKLLKKYSFVKDFQRWEYGRRRRG